MSEQPVHLTTVEIAEALRTSPETVRYWRHVGRGPKSFKVGRKVLYDRAEFEAWVSQIKQSDQGAKSA